MAAAAGGAELHYQDETHLETNPYLSKRWHRIGVQPTVPAAGTNRRLTCFGSVEAFGRGRVEVLCCQGQLKMSRIRRAMCHTSAGETARVVRAS